MAQYAHPEVLVETDWVARHLGDPKTRLNWQTQLQDQVRRDIISKDQFAKLVGAAGVSDDDVVILYGDNHNWFAAYGYWLFKLYGHKDVRLMNGGRAKWLNEEGRPLTTEKPKVKPATYTVKEVKTAEYRALLPEVLEASRTKSRNLVDVRSPDEFTGKIIAPPNLPETAQRGGHIPGAKSVPWSTAVNTQNGTFKSADELKVIYQTNAGVDFSKDTIAYCRIGERSSHTWFVLKYLLGVEKVKNYDGSWTEYGNLVAAPIEK
jgi:thiosulfate/3-mercaptopyruvate sulfurtransferase